MFFFYCWIGKSSKNQEDRRLKLLNISFSSRGLKLQAYIDSDEKFWKLNI